MFAVLNPKDFVDDPIYSLFVRANKTHKMLSLITVALELHFSRANYQAGIWIKAEVAILDTDVWKWLRTVPDACIELTSCGCKTKCKFTRCK